MTESNAHLADEISRQSSMIEGELWPRNFLASFALLLAGIYVSLWYILPAILALFATDLLAIRYMRNLHPDREPLRYQVVLILVFLREFSFTIVAAAVWQHTEGFAQPLAIGMVTTQLLQLAMIRAIHLPIGKIGLLGATIPVLIGNMIFWQANGLTDVGFLLTTLAGCGGLAYGLIAMQSNHRIHMASTADRAAALAADKAKSRFLAQMSHELRTPLNAILGMGHAELRRSTDVLSQQRLAVLIASAEGLSTILDDILDMSAVEEGRLPLRPAAVVPSDEIAATLALFQPGIEEAGLGLTRDISAALCQPLMLDPQRLRQCLSNLLS
ncbi:HAMP domain-containing sensor histidine kinase, partial [Pseudorhodobacter sp.]|uniref:sensor histidine kinase n=1 Tax=Pseudorhodobacter sp. TaxID=1934400 RepID=UPI00264943CC